MQMSQNEHKKPYGIAWAHVQCLEWQVDLEQLAVVFQLSRPIKRQYRHKQYRYTTKQYKDTRGETKTTD